MTGFSPRSLNMPKSAIWRYSQHLTSFLWLFKWKNFSSRVMKLIQYLINKIIISLILLYKNYLILPDSHNDRSSCHSYLALNNKDHLKLRCMCPVRPISTILGLNLFMNVNEKWVNWSTYWTFCVIIGRSTLSKICLIDVKFRFRKSRLVSIPIISVVACFSRFIIYIRQVWA